jgi:hypothetical protein
LILKKYFTTHEFFFSTSKRLKNEINKKNYSSDENGIYSKENLNLTPHAPPLISLFHVTRLSVISLMTYWLNYWINDKLSLKKENGEEVIKQITGQINQ